MSDFILYWLICMTALGALATVTTIGKPRKPITPSYAAVMLLWSVAYIAGYTYLLGKV